MKKHNKTGNEKRYQGTVLGKPIEDRSIKIEGGPAGSIQEWTKRTMGNGAKASRIVSASLNQDVDMAES